MAISNTLPTTSENIHARTQQSPKPKSRRTTQPNKLPDMHEPKTTNNIPSKNMPIPQTRTNKRGKINDFR